MTDDADHCPFLGLPVELRLAIYEHALRDGQSITIGSAELVGAAPDIVHRLYGSNRTPTPGLLQNHEPVVSSAYDSSLLSITNPAIIPVRPLSSDPPEPRHGAHSTYTALLLTNKQIRDELSGHLMISKNRKTSLFINYPHGLHILSTSAASLLKQARSIHLAGSYVPRTFNPQHGVVGLPKLSTLLGRDKYHGGFIPDHADELGKLIASLFGPHPRHTVQKLELRVYYPGPDSYSTVWGDDNSPTVVALRNVFAGQVTIEIWRGRWGTGVYLYVVPNVDEVGEGRGKRVVSTVWRKLEEREKECGRWVVDPKWPEWEAQGEGKADEGCVVEAVHVRPDAASP